MAKKREDFIDVLKLIIAVLTLVLKALEERQTSEDKLLLEGGKEND